ncbi:unnamed protein product [Arabis nemorensis]|uniref:Reverse transcriptase zinc-binding domain-containing protein n=1 Tax=Arabis nemorensis TaxID=586526 RepID=A0A565CU07_9BRAS|nr:unnamed protein product [Arabis nemorensis]
MGEVGTRLMGIPREAKVSDALRGNKWVFRRSRNCGVQIISTCLRTLALPNAMAGKDKVLWKQKNDTYGDKFSTKKTWHLIRAKAPIVEWHRLLWFSQAIPRQRFITWLASRNKLSTGARMRQWGITQACPLCGEPDETRDHLFFACPYGTCYARGYLRDEKTRIGI